MSKLESNQFMPDYAIHPGEILDETLSARNMKKSEFAERCQLSVKTVSQIINGKAPVTPETAIQFERVLGVSANIWNNLDAHYRLHMAKREDQRSLENQNDWVKRFPIKELVTRGLIVEGKSLAETTGRLLDFFGVASVAAWYARFKRVAVSYRKSPVFKSSNESVAAWLRIGEIEAEKIMTEPFDRKNFLEVLYRIRSLTSERPEIFEPRMNELCGQAGIALVFVAELPNTHLSGATRWLTSNKGLIILSLRHKSDDHFWFTFFHEAGHIFLHGKTSVFIDEEDMGTNTEEEQADRFAAHLLIPESKYRAFVNRGRLAKGDILQFSQFLNISPGIVVGRLQHDCVIPYEWHNGLKRKFRLI
jgi:HTH-type transcriptional regulator/antitoxin HigA